MNEESEMHSYFFFAWIEFYSRLIILFSLVTIANNNYGLASPCQS